MIKKFLLLTTFLMLAGAFSFLAPQKVIAARGDLIDIEKLSSQIDRFSSAGAKGFLVWQYSGSLKADETFGNDQYSFFKDETSGDKVCELIKSKAGQFEFIGVNMWDVGDAQYSQEVIEKHFSWLHNQCGVNVIRVFAKAGGVQGMIKILELARASNIKIIIAIGDYSNGGGGIPAGAPPSWYDSNYQDHKVFSQTIANAVSHHPALFGLELANEPHCAQTTTPDETISHYSNWGKDIGQLLRQHSNNVGYGQMADPNGICDSPSQGFRPTNEIPEITMTSAHFYNQVELDASLAALEISKQINKFFYIGEANWLTTNTNKIGNSDYLTVPLVLEPEKIAEGNGSDLVRKLIWNMVVDQGYEVSCASPELTVSATAFGDMMEYFSTQNKAPVYDRFNNLILPLGGQADYVLDLTESIIPMYRDLDEKSPGKTASYEAFFGTLNSDASNLSNETVLNSGVINNLLKPSQQCDVKLNNLKVAENLCNRLENPELCVLHTQIPNSEYYLFSTPTQESAGEKSLLTILEEWFSKDEIPFGCIEIMSPYEEQYQDILNIAQLDFDDVQTSLLNMTIDLEYVYRYAFIVLSPLQNVDAWCEKGEVDHFWFLNNHQQVYNDPDKCLNEYVVNRTKRIPSFVAIKIPILATNDIESLSIKNSASLTANILDRMSQQDNKVEIMQQQSRQEYLEEIIKVKKETWECGLFGDSRDSDYCNKLRLGLIVDCQGMPTCEGAHGAGTELRLALVHMINGSKQTCAGETFFASDDPMDIILSTDNPAPHGYSESVKLIGNPAAQSPSVSKTGWMENPQRRFLAEYFNVSENSAKNSLWQWKMELKENHARDILGGLGETNKVVTESVRVHIIAPLGIELSFIESRLASLFKEAQLAQMIEENVMVDAEAKSGNIARYFPIPGTNFGFNSTSTRYFPHEDCEFKKDPITGLPTIYKEECKAAGIKLSDDNVGLVIKGAKLGWFIRKIQQAITTDTSLNETYDYLASCERVEDLFLGKCGDGTYGPPGGRPWNGRDLGDSWSSDGKCVPITDSSSNAVSPCNVNNLITKLSEYIVNTNSTPISQDELNKRAIQASVICNAESGGNPNTLNDGCIKGTTLDYSVGLFQINLLAHNCPQYFKYSWGDKKANPPVPPSCSIIPPYTENDVNTCATPLLDANTNITKAFQLSGAGSNWWAWSTARPQHCNICSSSGVCNGLPEENL